MNTLKPLLLIAVLAAVGYGVYHRINSGPETPPPGVADGWNTAPSVQIPGEGAPMETRALGSLAGSPVARPFNSPPASIPGSPSGTGRGDNPAAVTGNNPNPQYDPAAAAPPFGSAPATARPGTGDYGAPSPDSGGTRAGSDYAGSLPEALRNPSPNVGASATGSGPEFASAFEAARRQLDEGRLAEAHQQLSIWYDDPRLSPAEQQRLTETLDQVAGTVVYSTQHLLEPPYEVQAGEKLEDIGQRYNVPWQLLAKINGIDDPASLQPGERLKVVRGPFNAVVSLDKREITLMLNGAYAGRFAIGAGRDNPPREGTFTVQEKVANPVYHGLGRTIDAGDPNNPLGKRLIGLGDQMSIHGTNDRANIGRPDQAGCIALGPQDIEDLYDILSIGSKIHVRR